MHSFEHLLIYQNTILIFILPFLEYFLSTIKWLTVKHIFYVSNHRYMFGDKMHISDCWLIELNELLMLFFQFCIYFLSIINQLIGEHTFYVSNFCRLFDNWMNFFIIDWFRKPTFQSYLDYFIFSLFQLSSDWMAILISKGSFLAFIDRIEFLSTFFGLHRSSLLWRFLFIEILLIFDCFVRIDRLSVNWYWNLSLDVVENFLWDIYKPEIYILFPAGLINGMVSVTVGCSKLFLSIDFFKSI